MLKIHIFRLIPGDDLRSEIVNYATKHNIKAGFIVSCVAGLSKVTLRMPGATPDKQVIRTYEGDFELTSLVGTVEVGNCHLHVTVTDKEGLAFGGHLKEDSTVRITAEVILGEETDKEFQRKLDERTGFEELSVEDAV